MGKGSGPAMPDPTATAEAQFDLNKKTALEAAKLNQIDQVSPWGNVMWSGEIGSPDRTQHTMLSPILGQLLFGQGYGDGGRGELLAQREAAAAAGGPDPGQQEQQRKQLAMLMAEHQRRQEQESRWMDDGNQP